MNDHELDRLLRRAQPASAARVPAVLPLLRAGGLELLGDIEDENFYPTGENEIVSVSRRRSPSRSVRWLLGAVAAVAVVLAVLLPMRFFGGRPESASPTGGNARILADRLPQTALKGRGLPFFVLDDPNWSLSHLQILSDRGDLVMAEKGSSRTLQIKWTKRSGEWREGAEPVTVFGTEGELRHRNGDPGYLLAFQHGNYVMSFSGDGFAEVGQYADVIAKMHQVGEKKWHASMPDWVITPEQVDAMMAAILRDVPVPGDQEFYKLSTKWPTPYSVLGKGIASDLGCAWLGEYDQAYQEKDEAGMAHAVEILRGSRRWKVVQQIDGRKEWLRTVQKSVDKMVERKPVTEEADFLPLCGEEL
ncbi:hypothetical protein [Kineosporia sp. NBRC 101731]|uniref:hypothetical protein n=1 Tax=Kineosporia sp. NBRC 101731 TaxID=3032199 RepID=UPI0024A4C8EC|nr:hypothetical protein [Kineosporia sp. NBRC 101731]GLY27337.1 hypothetical protein Kisp02_07020 [Kineosporia sp. NBRC 101731]